MTPEQEILTALKAIEAKLPLTPVAFNWTPAMSAVFGQMRPSMSGLLAMWDAMHEAAVYKGDGVASQPDKDGWIEWGGGECPVSYHSYVEVRYRKDAPDNMHPFGESISFWWGRGNDLTDGDIIAYRVVSP